MRTAPSRRPPNEAQPRARQTLDPRTLGRPIHLLGDFAARLKGDLAEHFDREVNRRYHASFEVGEVAFAGGAPADADAAHWIAYANPVGRIGFASERTLLLALVGYRYGESAPDADPSDAMRRTATEERFAAGLGLRLVQRLAARIDAGAQARDEVEAASGAFERAGSTRAPSHAWSVRVQVREPSLGLEARCWFTLDDAWMARLLRSIAPVRNKPAERSERTQPIRTRLQLTLTGRLLHKEVPLGAVMDLRAGDVLPIRVGAADVVVDDAPLFSAAVVEHGGKLCLTSFEYLD